MNPKEWSILDGLRKKACMISNLLGRKKKKSCGPASAKARVFMEATTYALCWSSTFALLIRLIVWRNKHTDQSDQKILHKIFESHKYLFLFKIHQLLFTEARSVNFILGLLLLELLLSGLLVLVSGWWTTSFCLSSREAIPQPGPNRYTGSSWAQNRIQRKPNN